MQTHQYFYVIGIVVAVVLAYAGFYNAVINRRFEEMTQWVKEHDRKFELINTRCMAELGRSAETAARLEALLNRLERLEEKIDRLLNGRK